MYEFDNYNEGEKIEEDKKEIEDEEIKNYMINMERKSDEIYGKQQMVATGEVTEFMKEIEKTKQMEIELKNKELELKNKELELKNKEIEYKIEKEKTKQIEIIKTICSTVKNDKTIMNIVNKLVI